MKTDISELSFYPIKPTPKGQIGYASLLLDKKFSVNCIAVYVKPDGSYRLLFPSKYLPTGKEVQTIYPVNAETYEAILKAVTDKIENVMKGSNHDHNNSKVC